MRYLGELRVRLRGDEKLAQLYIMQARTFLGFLQTRDLQLGGNDQAWQTLRLPNGVIISAVATSFGDVPIVEIFAPNPEEPEFPGPVQPLLLFRWEPEGILLTPRTAEAPDGWGLPRRDYDTGEKVPGLGTVGGPLPQILLNRYPNNKYFDNPRFLEGDLTDDVTFASLAPEDYIPPLTRDTYDTEVEEGGFTHEYLRLTPNYVSYSEPDEEAEEGTYIFDTTTPEAGAYLADELLKPQRDISEIQTEEWHTHRPEELLYELEVYEEIYKASNELRTDAEEERVFRPLRGEKDPAKVGGSILTALDNEVFAHSYFGWRPGYRTAVGRFHGSMGVTPYGFFNNNTGENILAEGSTRPANVNTPAEVGQWVVEQWEGSPRHFDNIVNPLWTANESFPWHPWSPRGTRGGFMHVSGLVEGSYSLVWVPNLSSYGYELDEENPAVTGPTWVQAFSARESWLPVYSYTYETGGRISGTFGSTCPFNREPYGNQRRAGVGSVVYEIPEGNEFPAFSSFSEDIDDVDPFHTVLGCAPYEKNEQRWVRMVYWRSSEAITPNDPPPSDLPDRYGELVVVSFPEGLGDSPLLPWREDEEPEEWEEEFTRTFSVVDGWVPEPEGTVQFNSDGTKFLLEMERCVDGSFITEGIPRNARIVGGLSGNPTTLVEITDTTEIPKAAVERVVFEYESATLTELDTANPLPEVQVDTGFLSGDNAKFYYNRSVSGEYKIWYHYDAEDDLAWYTLIVDEDQTQGGPQSIADVYSFDPSAPLLRPDHQMRNYRRRKLRFPSGKEVVYLQQYTIVNFAVDFDPEDAPTGYTNYFPGDGENFYAVFHYLDLKNEVLIYSKHGTVTYNNYDNTDPAGDVFKDILEATRPPNEPGGIPNMSWTRGDSVYLLDAFSGAERVQDEFVSYANVDDSPEPRYQYMSLFGSAGKNRELLSGFDIYPMAVTPYAFLSLVGTGNFVYAYNVQMMFAGLGFSDVSDASFFDESESFENEVRNGFFSYEPVDNYNVSVSTRKPIGGENSVDIFRFDAAGEEYYEQRISGFYHNIAPLFSGDAEARAKLVRYEDRWVARLEIRHINRNGILPPAENTQPRPFENYLNQDFNVTAPADGNGDSADYKRSCLGIYPVNWLAYNDNGTAVHLLSNFDLDVAAETSDVIDIAPFGRL
jgi:hypothetical protein